MSASGGSAKLSSPAGKIPRAPQKPKKRVRRNQEELKFLRVQVRRLEHQVEQFQLGSEPRAATMKLPTAINQEQTDSSGRPTAALSVWEGIAERQVKERMRSEKENASLKGLRSAYADLLLELQRRLRKAVGQEEREMLAECKVKQQTFWSASVEDDADLFADQLAYLMRVYHQLGHQHPLGPSAEIHFHWQLAPALELVQPNSSAPAGVTLGMHCATTIPFDMDVAGQAYWRMFQPRVASVTSEATSAVRDVGTETIAFEIKHEEKVMRMRYKQCRRRHEERDSITIMWAANGWPVQFGGVKFHGLIIQKVGWIKLRGGSANAHGLQQAPSLTTVEMYTKAIPLFQKGAPDQEFQMQMYINMIGKVHATLSEGFSQRLSHLLLDEDWKARYGSELIAT